MSKPDDTRQNSMRSGSGRSAGDVRGAAASDARTRNADRGNDRENSDDGGHPADSAYVEMMSSGQQRLWLLDQLLADRATYNSPRVLRLVGSLDLSALERSIDEVLRRHDSLRTRLAVVDGQPRQLIDPATRFQLAIDDISALPRSERDVIARTNAKQACVEPFDLAQGPLFRARLLRLAADEHWLLLNLHHAVTDLWSAGVLARELAALYAAFRDGAPSPLAELPLQYADFAAWQREWLGSDAMARQLAFWRRALENVAVLEISSDRPRRALSGDSGGRVPFTIGPELRFALKELGQRSGATLFMVLLAAWQVLLHRYSGQDDIAVGVPIAARTRRELEGLIGFFVNTLVLRADLRGDDAGTPTFAEHLARVRQSALDAYEHQDLPFEKLVEELAPRRDPLRNPLFQASFAFQNVPPPEWRLAGLAVESIQDVFNDSAKFDLSLTVVESNSALDASTRSEIHSETEPTLRGRIDYAVALFDARTIEAMVAQWLTLLRAIVANPEQRVSELSLQSAAERERLLAEWNLTGAGNRHDSPLHALFEAQVARTPEAIALRDGDIAFSYRELNARANQLARHIQARAVQGRARGADIVGICLPRGHALVTAVLATIKAGVAYLPLDPALPQERVATMLADAAAPLVLTEQRLRALLPTTVDSVCLDTEQMAIAGEDDGNLDARAVACHQEGSARANADGRQTAYVMYTSGSSGRPKGISIAHRSVARLVIDTNYLQLGPRDVVAQISNPAFDAATFEIWGALLNGAQLSVIDHDTVLSPTAFAAALDRNGVTTLFVTTALFNQLARIAPSVFRDRDVLFGGESVEPRWVEAVLRDGRPRRLLHVYGPTETTTFATWHEVRSVAPNAATIPIGRPIANTQVYLLDRHREPVPAGIPGEIYIGGPGLASGYLNDPDLTSARFVAHPFERASDARLYRTGDRGRLGPGGALEFLGRADRQVKIRGHRIEIDEVEAALARLPQVAEAVVVAHGSTSDTRQLTAYVVATAGQQPTPAELWAQLRVSLPDYMAPAAMVMLLALPLTPNGKIDRHALPAPSDLALKRTGWHVPPQDPLDFIVAQLWEELLAVRNIGITDNFFDLGGHSLLAAEMLDAVERAVGCRVSLAALFAEPTIAHLTRTIRASAQQNRAPLVALNATGTRLPFFFLHGDFTGGGFFSHKLARALGPSQPFYAVHPHGLIDGAVPASIEAMAADRVAAILAVRPHGPYLLGGHCAGGMVALEIARQLTGAGEHVACVLMIDSVAPVAPKLVFEGVSIGPGVARSRKRSIESDGTDGAGNLFARYRNAIKRYAPAPYAGRTVVLCPEGRRDPRPLLGWGAVNPMTEMVIVPGDHHTVITQHIESTATHMRACLQR